MILGGLYHDFNGFALAMMSLFKGDGWTVEATYDLDALTRLDALGCQVMLSYTCLSKNGPEQEQATPERLTDEQVRGLRNWVQNGGALLAAHCATVIGESHAELARLLAVDLYLTRRHSLSLFGLFLASIQSQTTSRRLTCMTNFISSVASLRWKFTWSR